MVAYWSGDGDFSATVYNRPTKERKEARELKQYEYAEFSTFHS
jgi:hypothetical protein